MDSVQHSFNGFNLFRKIFILVLCCSHLISELSAQCNSIDLSATANATAICVGEQLNLNSTITGLTGNPSITYSWVGPNGFTSSTSDPNSFPAIIATEGSYTLIATVNGCPDPIESSIFIDVLPLPAVPTFNLPPNGCPGVAIPITGFTPVNGVTYTWNNSGGNVNGGSSSNPTAIFQNGGSNAVSVTATLNGCSVTSLTDNISITQLSLNPPDVSVNGNFLTTDDFNGETTYSLCDGTSSGTAEISNLIPGTNNAATTYTFSWGTSSPVSFNNTIGQSISLGDNLFSVTGVYNGCTVTENFNLYVGSNPSVAIGVGSSTNLCPGTSVTANITPVNQQGQLNSPGTTYELYFSNNPGVVVQSFSDISATTAAIPFVFSESSCGAGANNPCFPNQANVFYAYVVATNACANSCASSPAITYNSPPEANFSLSNDTVCINSNVIINNTGQVGNTTTGSSGAGYTCNSTSKIKYTIAPNSGFMVVSGDLGGTSGNYNNWTGTNSVTVNFNTPGTYTITQNAQANSCGSDVITQTICVESPPSVAITAAPLQGCAPLNIDVTNNSVDNSCAVTRLWTSTQTATGCNPQPVAPTITSPTLLDPTVVFEEAGVYTITLTMTNSCGAFSQTSQPITVKTRPIVTLPTFSPVCAGQSCISPTATVQNCGGTTGPTYSWSFTGGSPINSTQQLPGLVCYNVPGTYTISANATNECGLGTSSQTLNVISCSGVVDAGGPYEVCGASPITLNAFSSGPGQWSGGLGIFSNVGSVNSTYTPEANEIGTTVNLTWTTIDPDGGTDQATLTVTTPATFNPLTPVTICSNSTAQLSVVTTPSTGSWSGGSGTFSSASSPNAEYTPGAADNTNANLNLVWTTSDPDGNGPCQPLTVNQPLDVIGTSTAEAGGPYLICGEDAVMLNAVANGAGQWTGGAGTFSNATLVNSTYTPASGEIGTTINLTWTTNDPDGIGPCLPAEDMALLVVEPCVNDVTGCTDILACNFDSLATESDNSCIYPEAFYLDCNGNCINDLDSDGVCDEIEVSGCTNPDACNYDALATEDDGSCEVLVAAEIIGNITPDAFSVEDYSYINSVAGSTLQWTITNGVIISGQGTESVQIQWAAEGLGAVQVQEVVDADCIGPLTELNVVVLPVQGVLEYSNSGIMVYPNPAIDKFRVKGGSSMTGCSWKLMDITGRVVQQGIFQSAEGVVSLSKCVSGQYVLQVASNNEIFEERVIKMELY